MLDQLSNSKTKPRMNKILFLRLSVARNETNEERQRLQISLRRTKFSQRWIRSNVLHHAFAHSVMAGDNHSHLLARERAKDVFLSRPGGKRSPERSCLRSWLAYPHWLWAKHFNGRPEKAQQPSSQWRNSSPLSAGLTVLMLDSLSGCSLASPTSGPFLVPCASPASPLASFSFLARFSRVPTLHHLLLFSPRYVDRVRSRWESFRTGLTEHGKPRNRRQLLTLAVDAWGKEIVKRRQNEKREKEWSFCIGPFKAIIVSLLTELPGTSVTTDVTYKIYDTLFVSRR